MDILSYLVPVALVGWVVARQFAGRFVPARRSSALPVVLVVAGLGQVVHVPWTTLAVVAVVATLTATFGVSLAAQYVVFNARVAADGRPVRPAGDRPEDRRSARARATLGR